MGVMGDRSPTKFRIPEKSPTIFFNGHPSTPTHKFAMLLMYILAEPGPSHGPSYGPLHVVRPVAPPLFPPPQAPPSVYPPTHRSTYP